MTEPFQECEQFSGRLRAICRGEILSAEKTRKWRQNRGLDQETQQPTNQITGLGDVVHAIAHATGLDKIADSVAKTLGKKDCGCAARRKKLNEMFPLP